MSSSDPQSVPPFTDRNTEKMKERTPLNQPVIDRIQKGLHVSIFKAENPRFTCCRPERTRDLAKPQQNPALTTWSMSTDTDQVVTFKPSSMQRVVQVMHRMAQKSYIRACRLFCLPLEPMLCEKVTCCSAPSHQPKEDTNTQVALQSPPSTILIVNISNSTLIDCVIGSETYPSTVTERQPLMQESELHMHGHVRCSCGCGQQEAAQRTSPPPPPLPPPPLWPLPPSAEHLNVTVHSSHLNCVIIGDNNYMHAEQSQPFD